MRVICKINTEELDNFMGDIVQIAKKHGVTEDTVVNVKKALEAERCNDLSVQHGDCIDGHNKEICRMISGFIEWVNSIVSDMHLSDEFPGLSKFTHSLTKTKLSIDEAFKRLADIVERGAI